MTDRELRKNLKKLGIAMLVLFLLIGSLAVYTLLNQKADLSIYTDAGYVDNLQALGIDENEFKGYLSVFGNLVDSEFEENQRVLNTATSFLENMYSSYEVQVDENGRKSYDAEVVKKIAQEVQGIFVKDKLEGGALYTYQDEAKSYQQKEKVNRIAYCTEIKEIVKQGEQLEVEYVLGIMTNEQLANYQTGQEVSFESYCVKALLMKNRDYEYSKYFVSDIKKI